MRRRFWFIVGLLLALTLLGIVIGRERMQRARSGLEVAARSLATTREMTDALTKGSSRPAHDSTPQQHLLQVLRTTLSASGIEPEVLNSIEHLPGAAGATRALVDIGPVFPAQLAQWRNTWTTQARGWLIEECSIVSDSTGSPAVPRLRLRLHLYFGT